MNMMMVNQGRPPPQMQPHPMEIAGHFLKHETKHDHPLKKGLIWGLIFLGVGLHWGDTLKFLWLDYPKGDSYWGSEIPETFGEKNMHCWSKNYF